MSILLYYHSTTDIWFSSMYDADLFIKFLGNNKNYYVISHLQLTTQCCGSKNNTYIARDITNCLHKNVEYKTFYPLSDTNKRQKVAHAHKSIPCRLHVMMSLRSHNEIIKASSHVWVNYEVNMMSLMWSHSCEYRVMSPWYCCCLTSLTGQSLSITMVPCWLEPCVTNYSTVK